MPQKIFISTLLNYRDFYPESFPEDKLQLAKKIGRKFGIETCCHFLGNFRHRGIPRIDILIQLWFTYYDFKYFENPSYYEILERLNRIRYKDPDGNYVIIAVEPFLQMISWLTTQPDIPNEVKIDASQALPLLKLCLLFNQDLTDRYKVARKIIAGIPNDRRDIQKALAISFPQNDFTNPDYAQTFNTQFYKAARLLDYMEASPKFKTVVEALLEDFQCSSIEEYFNYIGKIILLGTQSRNNGWTIINVPDYEQHDAVCHVMDKLAVDATPVPQLQDDFLELRSRPLIKVGESKYMVIYDMFLIKKIYNGLIFYLSKKCEKIPGIGKNFLSLIRDEFSEGQLLYDSVRYAFEGTKSISISGKEFRKNGLVDSEPDFYLRLNNDILLFESKDFYVPGKIKFSFDFEKIEKELTTDKEGEPDRLGKGLLQLKRNIIRIISKTLPGDHAYTPSEITIFPIILIHDGIYSAPGLNYWFYYKLKDLLEELKADGKYTKFEFKCIMPLTLVEIDTLLFFEESFHQNKLYLIELLRAYHRSINYPDINPKSLLSFSTFVRTLAMDGNLRLEAGRLRQILLRFGVDE